MHPPRTHLAARTPKSPPRPVLYPAPPSVIHFSAASRGRAREGPPGGLSCDGPQPRPGGFSVYDVPRPGGCCCGFELERVLSNALGPAGCYAVFFHQLAVTDRRSGVSAESGSWSIETAVTPIKTVWIEERGSPRWAHQQPTPIGALGGEVLHHRRQSAADRNLPHPSNCVTTPESSMDLSTPTNVVVSVFEKSS